MRRLMCDESAGKTVQEVLSEFNRRHTDDIEEEDIVSVSVRACTDDVRKIKGLDGAQVMVSIVYWSDD